MTKKQLKLSAGEMICLIRYFTLFVGEKVPFSDEIWDLFLSFRRIFDVVMSPRYVQTHLLMLTIEIQDFLEKYLKYFGDLKYKFHNMLHIPRTMGPMVNFWSMRYESKHTEVKAASSASYNKINLLKTITVRILLRIAYLKQKKKIICDELIYNKKQTINPKDKLSFWPESLATENIFTTNNVLISGI